MANKFSARLLSKISGPVTSALKLKQNSISSITSESILTLQKSRNYCSKLSSVNSVVASSGHNHRNHNHNHHPCNTSSNSVRQFNNSMNSGVCPVFGHSVGRNQTTGVNAATTGATLPYEAVPSPKGLPLVGTLFNLIASGGAPYMHLYCDRRHNQLGPIYKETLGNVEGVFIADAALMQKVLSICHLTHLYLIYISIAFVFVTLLNLISQ